MAKGILKDLWKKEKDGRNYGQRSFVRYAIIATFLTLVFLMVKKDNLFVWISAARTLKQQQNQIEKLETENSSLDATINSLRTDRDSLEKFARETYLFSAAGEHVYVFEESR